jgi:hypothetical protein
VDPSPFFYIHITVYYLLALFYFLANYYLLPHDMFNPLFTANRWDWQSHCKLGQITLVVLCPGSWYLANVSIIFDAPCLFYTNCYMFYLHFMALLWFIWTNLLIFAKVHNVLVLHFDVYELPRIQVETLLESNWDFPEICARTLFEDGHVMGQRRRQMENSSTMNFTANVLHIKFAWFWVRTVELGPI